MFMVYPTILLSQIMSLIFVTNVWAGSLKSYLRRIYSIIEQASKPNIYLFLENYPQPFPARLLDLDSPHTAPPELVYNADSTTFYPYKKDSTYETMIQEHKPKRLPVLSIEILDGESNVIFDLTDFIDRVRFINISGTDIPNISEIISAWSIESYVVLNKNNYNVRYIMNDGEMYELPLNEVGTEEEEEEEVVEDVIIEDVSGQEIQADDINVEEID